MKVVMAPVNIAGQPILLVKQLRKMGLDISLLQFMPKSKAANKFGYETDRVETISARTRPGVQMETLGKLLDEGTDIFHFWLRSSYYGRANQDLQGIDLPIIKAHQRKIVYRFTGFDLRLKTAHMNVNPHNPFKHGYDHGMDEEMQKGYLDWLRHYVDQFVVQDPELGEFMPNAATIPRSMDMSRWEPVGVDPNKKRPLVIHSPSSTEVKGTKFVLEAVETLQKEGLDFEFKLIQNLKHHEAIELYKQCDIAIDQLLIGWYGVFSLEAMALAKPTIVYVRDEPLSRLGEDLPIQNANPITITDKLRELILDGKRRQDLGARGRDFVERYHSVEVVAEQLAALYQDVYARPHEVPIGPAGPSQGYMAKQVMDTHASVIDSIHAANEEAVAEKDRTTYRERFVEAQAGLTQAEAKLAKVTRDFDRLQSDTADSSQQIDDLREKLHVTEHKLLLQERARRTASPARRAALAFFEDGAGGLARSFTDNDAAD